MFEEQAPDEGDEFFAAVDDVSAGGQRLPYLEEGLYVLQIDKILFIVTRPPQRNPLYIVECTILESNNEARPAGLKCSWSTKLNTDMGPINMKRFVGAAVGFGLVEEHRLEGVPLLDDLGAAVHRRPGPLPGDGHHHQGREKAVQRAQVLADPGILLERPEPGRGRRGRSSVVFSSPQRV
jgi:hypothetical protein